MPELPEVEVVKLFLEQKLLHKTITQLEILTPKSFVGDPKKVINNKIVKFSRIGKQLSIHLSNQLILLVHLKMTGQLIYLPALSREGVGKGFVLGHPTKDAFSKLPNKSTRVIFHFSKVGAALADARGVLYFNDQRKFGWVRVYSSKELKLFQSTLGLDIFDPKFSFDNFFLKLQSTKALIKVVLLNQKFFAGIGNIYANDALFLSGIHPQTPSNKISRSKALTLYRSILSIMRQSVLAGGSTARDRKYLRPDGTSGQNQFFFRVYERKGEPCLKCGTKIEYFKLGGRGTFFCPQCQTL